MTDDIDDPFLTIDEAAQLLRVSRRTLDNYRSRKRGPPYRRHGGRIVYRLGDLLAWSEQRRARYPKCDKDHEAPPVHNGAPRDRRARNPVPQGRRPGPPLERQPQRPGRSLSVGSRPSQTAALAVIRLPEPLRILAETRGYLRKGALLIKPIAAGAGDRVCRHDALVTVNGRIVARARTLDAAGRSLPAWSGCFQLGASDIFVLSADPDSFDGRYMGPIDRAHVMGFAGPIWVRPAAPTSAPAAS